MPMPLFALRWRILALLFFVRMTMAIQFQMVGALSPEFEAVFAVGLADVGVLIGLYFAPGILLSTPGGLLGSRFGEVRVVLVGLGLMAAGGALMSASGDWSAVRRTVVIGAGIGGLAATVRLAHAGHEVLVLEMASHPGGKLRALPSAAGPVDAGPTVFTLKPYSASS